MSLTLFFLEFFFEITNNCQLIVIVRYLLIFLFMHVYINFNLCNFCFSNFTDSGLKRGTSSVLDRLRQAAEKKELEKKKAMAVCNDD